MKKIIAIGGGEIGGFQNTKVETLDLDKEIISLSKKKSPRLLFIPTASNDSSVYIKAIEKYFGKKLGCKINTLELISKKYSKKEIEEKILKTDIIYVGGGDTLKMMNIWRRLGVDKLLHKAMQKGIVLSGLSAGSICWFQYGNSDSRRFGKNKNADMIRVTGLGMIPILHCPHYDGEKYREKSLKDMMEKKGGIAIALDNCAALEVIGEKYRIIRTKKTANAYKVYWSKKKYCKELIPVTKEFKSLKELLK